MADYARECRETLGTSEVAEILDVQPVTVRRALERGQLPGIRVGRLWRIPRRAFEALLESPRDLESLAMTGGER